MRLKYFILKYNLIRALLYLFIFPKNGYGVEIGVWRGRNAKMLYYFARPNELTLVDPYESGLCDEVYQPVYPQDQMDKMYFKVMHWCNKKGVLIYRRTSGFMSKYLGHYFDWVYIDGDHSDVYNDLNCWYHNLKDGGIIMGDDYGNKGYPLVKEDVDRFCKEKGIKLHRLHFQFWFKK